MQKKLIFKENTIRNLFYEINSYNNAVFNY